MARSLRPELSGAILFQGTTAAMALLATGLVGSRYGSSGLGTFSLTQSRIQFVAAAAMLGLPQALIYFIARRQASRKLAVRLTGGVFLVGTMLGVGLALGPWGYGLAPAALLALAAATQALSTMQRAAGPRRGSGASIQHGHWPPSSPPARLGRPVHGDKPRRPFSLWLIRVLWAPFIGAAIYGWRALSRLPPEGSLKHDVSAGGLYSFALAGGLVAVIASGTRALWIGHTYSVAGAAEAGVLSAALLVVQVATFPAVLVAPILMRSWVASPTAGRTLKAFLAVTMFGLAACLSGLVLSSAASGARIPQIFTDYEALVPMLGLVGLLAGTEMAYLIGATLLLSEGHPWGQFLADLGRAAVLAVAWVAAGQGIDGGSALKVWVLASFVAAGVAWAGVWWSGGRCRTSLRR